MVLLFAVYIFRGIIRRADGSRTTVGAEKGVSDGGHIDTQTEG